MSPREPGSAVVTASVNDVSASATVTFTTALPEEATLSVSGTFKITAAFASKVFLRLRLFRSTGTVSKGVEAAFEVQDASTGQD